MDAAAPTFRRALMLSMRTIPKIQVETLEAFLNRAADSQIVVSVSEVISSARSRRRVSFSANDLIRGE
jgi:hypothetical protein